MENDNLESSNSNGSSQAGSLFLHMIGAGIVGGLIVALIASTLGTGGEVSVSTNNSLAARRTATPEATQPPTTDVTPPVITLVNPLEGQSIKAGSRVVLEVKVTDESPVILVNFDNYPLPLPTDGRSDYGLVQMCGLTHSTGPNTYKCTWNVPPTIGQDYMLVFRALDDVFGPSQNNFYQHYSEVYLPVTAK